MTNSVKIQIAGVGGQGVVYLTNLLVEAAMVADIPVSTSEIHGLSRRGGSISTGVTLGAHTYGFIEKGGADFLLGLEALEAQRCAGFLHKNSKAVIDNHRILPYSVNSENAKYPDTRQFIEYLKKNIANVIFIEEMPEEVPFLSRNVFIAGCASKLEGFPLKYKHFEQALKNISGSGSTGDNLRALNATLAYKDLW